MEHMETANKRIFLWLFVFMTLNCYPVLSQQRGIDSTANQPPIANNDTASVYQPNSDTINVTANDYSPSGDSFCMTAVYGSTFFSQLNCNDIVFTPDSNFIGKDTVWYIICNVGQSTLCDTATLVVNVYPHYTPFILNNA